jgi:hypothetical protein
MVQFTGRRSRGLEAAFPSPEQKVLAIRDETLGGVLAPPEFIAEVVKGVIQYSPDSCRLPRCGRLAARRFSSRSAPATLPLRGRLRSQTRTETTGRTYGLDEIRRTSSTPVS